MAAAIPAFTLPSTQDLLDATLANTGTMLGALCFLWGARLLLVTPKADATSAAPTLN